MSISPCSLPLLLSVLKVSDSGSFSEAQQDHENDGTNVAETVWIGMSWRRRDWRAYLLLWGERTARTALPLSDTSSEIQCGRVSVSRRVAYEIDLGRLGERGPDRTCVDTIRRLVELSRGATSDDTRKAMRWQVRVTQCIQR